MPHHWIRDTSFLQLDGNHSPFPSHRTHAHLYLNQGLCPLDLEYRFLAILASLYMELPYFLLDTEPVKGDHEGPGIKIRYYCKVRYVEG